MPMISFDARDYDDDANMVKQVLDDRNLELRHVKAQNEQLRTAIASLLTHEHWCDYLEGNRTDYHICWFCGGTAPYADKIPPLDQFPHEPDCVALAVYKLIQGVENE